MGDIRTRFTLEGEQQYKRAMSEAANAVKVLNAEQKLAKAQFKNTGDAEKYAAQQSDILKKKIDEQKKAVKAAEEALRQLSENGVEKSSRQFQQWQMRLTNAQTSLVQMETELNSVSGSMDNVNNKSSQMANSLSSINKKVSFDAVIGGIGSITGALESAAKKAKEVGEQIWDDIKKSAKWADDSATMAEMYEIPLDRYLRMQKLVSNGLDTSVEAQLTAMDKMSTGIGKKSAATMEALEDLGLVYMQYGGKVAEGTKVLVTNDPTEMFWKAGEALRNMPASFDKNAAAMALFGRSWRDMVPLFNKYDSLESYEEALAGVTVNSEDAVDKMAQLNDRISELESAWNDVKLEALSALAPALSAAAEALSGLLNRVTEYLKTDEGQKKLEKLEESVSKLFGDLSNIDPEDVVDKFAGVLTKITDAFTWIGEHWNDVKIGLEGIGLAFGALKLASVALNLGKIVSGFQTLWNGANKKLPSAPDVPQQQPTTNTTPKATAPNVAPTNLPINTGAPSVSPTMYATVPGLTGMVGTGGMGGVVGGMGTLSAVGALGGTALIAGGVYLTAEIVNEVNRAAEKMREVKEDLHRYDNFLTEETIRQASEMAYVSGPMGDKRLVLQDTVRKLMKTTGSDTGINSYQNILKWLGYNLNKNVLEAFNYTNTSGDSRNKLMDMLGMDDQRSATAAMILKSAGYTYNDSRLTTEQQSLFQEGLGALKKINDLGSTLGTEGFGTILDFFKSSGYFNENGEWTIPGLEEEMTAQQAAADAMNAASETMSGLPEAVAKAVSGVKLEVNIPMFGHANGLWSVPYDGYPAILHRGERVLPARDAGSYTYNTYFGNVNLNNGLEIEALTESIDRRNRRQRTGYGS